MSEMRYDYSTGENLTLPAVFNADGTMTARPIITSIGVFKYRKADGSIGRELRTPEVVSDPLFLESIKRMPIYIGHKLNMDGTLITDPAKRAEITVGQVDEFPVTNNVYVAAGITINRADGLDAIRSGMQSLSVGYNTKAIKESGIWCGQEYDSIQTELRADHLALVFAGRQGDQSVIRMDSTDAELVTDAAIVADTNIEEPNKEKKMSDNMKTIKLDGVDFSAEPQVIIALNTAQTRLDEVEADLIASIDAKSTLEAERDSMKARLDISDAKIVELEAARVDEAMITERVAQRIALVKSAEKAEVEVKLDASDMEIKKAVIMKVYPSTNLEGKTDAYMAARFDCACEDLEKTAVTAADVSVRSGNAPVVHVDSNDSASAQARMIERMQNNYKAKK